MPTTPLLGLPGRIGQLLLAPRDGLARVDREGGGLNDALRLVALGTVAFRFPSLLEALLGLSALSLDAVLRVVSVVANELVGAAWFVLPAAVVVTALAGARRDSSRDLELAGACYAPYFAASAAFRAIEAVTGAQTAPLLVARLVPAVFAVPALARAVAVARARTGATSEPDGVRPLRSAVLAGLAVLGVASVGLAGSAVWSARHLDALMPVRRGAQAPDFAVARVDGQPGTVALGSMKGQAVVLDFWATYCPPCRQMMPVLDELHREWAGKGVSFVGVDSEDIDPQMLRDFLVEHPIPYPIVADDGALGASYKVRALPTLVVIGKDGTVRDSFVGFTLKSTLERALARAVATR
ncbi:MAG TPA: TlpA disulfide reductase family protein [Polyangia bacterium]|nr:TlpA disulfide reductase family protein [Polyangia bacterium]